MELEQMTAFQHRQGNKIVWTGEITGHWAKVTVGVVTEP